jgi:hypothetical protein
MEPGTLPLRDLHLPDAIGTWPLAPGWWVVMLLLIVGIVIGLRYLWRNFDRGRSRRIALRRLSELRADYDEHRDAVAFASAVSELLRRAMLAYSRRADVAGLTGEAWLNWLDRDLAIPQFDGDAARGLLELPYREPGSDVSDIDIERLVEAVRLRLLTPVGEPG